MSQPPDFASGSAAVTRYKSCHQDSASLCFSQFSRAGYSCLFIDLFLFSAPVASSGPQTSLVPNSEKRSIKEKPGNSLGVNLQVLWSLASPLSSLYISKCFYDCSIISQVIWQIQTGGTGKNKSILLCPKTHNYIFNGCVNNIKWLERVHPIFPSYILIIYL